MLGVIIIAIFSVYLYFISEKLFYNQIYAVESSVFILMLILRMVRLAIEMTIIVAIWYYFSEFVEI